jgi:hypothetical protein
VSASLLSTLYSSLQTWAATPNASVAGPGRVDVLPGVDYPLSAPLSLLGAGPCPAFNSSTLLALTAALARLAGQAQSSVAVVAAAGCGVTATLTFPGDSNGTQASQAQGLLQAALATAAAPVGPLLPGYNISLASPTFLSERLTYVLTVPTTATTNVAAAATAAAASAVLNVANQLGIGSAGSLLGNPLCSLKFLNSSAVTVLQPSSPPPPPPPPPYPPRPPVPPFPSPPPSPRVTNVGCPKPFGPQLQAGCDGAVTGLVFICVFGSLVVCCFVYVASGVCGKHVRTAEEAEGREEDEDELDKQLRERRTLLEMIESDKRKEALKQAEEAAALAAEAKRASKQRPGAAPQAAPSEAPAGDRREGRQRPNRIPSISFGEDLLPSFSGESTLPVPQGASGVSPPKLPGVLKKTSERVAQKAQPAPVQPAVAVVSPDDEAPPAVACPANAVVEEAGKVKKKGRPKGGDAKTKKKRTTKPGSGEKAA